jgi:predicted outer membrane repeat protein
LSNRLAIYGLQADRLYSCTFSNNTARNGGGLYGNYASHIGLNNCTVSGNSASN